jgi:hypothetical protein
MNNRKSMIHLLVFLSLFSTFKFAMAAESEKEKQKSQGIKSDKKTAAQTEEEAKELEERKKRESWFGFRVAAGADIMANAFYLQATKRREIFFDTYALAKVPAVKGPFNSLGLGFDFNFMRILWVGLGADAQYMTDKVTGKLDSAAASAINSTLFAGASVVSAFSLSHEVTFKAIRFTPRIGINLRLGRFFNIRPFVGYYFGPVWYEEKATLSGLSMNNSTITYTGTTRSEDRIGGIEFLIFQHLTISVAHGGRRIHLGTLKKTLTVDGASSDQTKGDKGDFEGRFWDIRLGGRF